MRNTATRRVRQRLVAITTVALAGTALAACGSGSEDSQGAGSTDPSAPIEYWHRLPDVKGATTVDELVADYNKQSDGAKVTATTMQGAAVDSYPKIATAVQSGSAPCLAQVGSERMPDLLSTGQLMDVTEYAQKYEDEYLPYAWSRATIGGSTYGIPQDTAPLALFYRADVFKRLGIEPPTTWAEYRAASEKVKADNPKARLGNLPADPYFPMSWPPPTVPSGGASRATGAGRSTSTPSRPPRSSTSGRA